MTGTFTSSAAHSVVLRPSPLSSSSAIPSLSLKPSVLSTRNFPKTSSRRTFPSDYSNLPHFASHYNVERIDFFLNLVLIVILLLLLLLAGIYAFSSNDIKVGTSIEVDGAPWRVLEFLHVKPGKGAAFVRTKLKNYITGSTVEKTFRAGITVEEAEVSKETKQFTYKDGAQFVFMDLTTYEEYRLNEKDLGDKIKWLKEGMDCNLLFWNGKVIDFELPLMVKLTVVDVDPGLRGDTAQGGSKPATVDTGAVVNVPLFVHTGDEIMVDTRTGQYSSRA